jgi:hypothetical protein
MALAVAEALLTGAPAPGWGLIRGLVDTDPDFGRDVLKAVAHGERADLAAGLDDADLADVVERVFILFPPSEDPPLEAGAGFVSRSESVRWMRQQFLQVLAERGTREAIGSIERLNKQEQSHMTRWALRIAKEARRAMWVAPTPQAIVQLAHSNGGRIILSAAHLQAAVMMALRRIQRAVSSGTPPAAPELWNNLPRRPRAEEELSDWLALRMTEQLVAGGLIVGREVQLTPNATGRGRGQCADLQISAPLGELTEGAETATILLEVKGAWNRDVRIALRHQLAERYLIPAGCQHGVYVVLWFAGEHWDREDHRRAKGLQIGFDEASDLFRQQAQDASTALGLEIRSFVLDGSL